MKALFVAAVVFALCGCEARAERCRFDADTCADLTKRTKQLQWVLTADATADARAAIQRGDPPLIGLYGYSEWYPGVPRFDKREGCKTQVIEGTSDVVDRKLFELQERAARYAETYNRLVLPHSGCSPQAP